MLKDLWQAIGGATSDLERVTTSGSGALRSAFPVSGLAAASVGVAALSISELLEKTQDLSALVHVDRRLASFWFQSSIRPIGWTIPQPWDAIAGDYLVADGWIRLHTNAPHHRLAAERVLGARGTKENVAKAVAGWTKGDLEAAIVEAGGCAAEMRSIEEWRIHPQGVEVAREKLVDRDEGRNCSASNWLPTPQRPLAGVKVLDLTRVLAGPVATRFLAGYGADVLRIDPPGWDEPAVVPDVTLGKRCARLDLRTKKHRAIFERLLSQSDILLNGYRPGALDSLGYGAQVRRQISPDILDVTLSAYGWTGPWASRRGFDSLVQMSTGIADAGMKWSSASKPIPLPVQALDHATGYLLAATAVRALTNRVVRQVGTDARLSLARTSNELISHRSGGPEQPLEPETTEDLEPDIEATAWGTAMRLRPPAQVEGAPMFWTIPSGKLGSSSPAW